MKKVSLVVNFVIKNRRVIGTIVGSLCVLFGRPEYLQVIEAITEV